MHLSSPRTRSHGLDRTALWLMHATVAASIVMQEAKGDFLPPQVSMSQYGVGRYGWSFTLTLTLWALASLAMAAADVLRAPPTSGSRHRAVGGLVDLRGSGRDHSGR